MPGEVAREHAQKDVGSHALLQPVIDGAQVEVDGLDRSHIGLDVGEVLVGLHDAGSVQAIVFHAVADDVDAVEGGFRGDAGLVAGVGELAVVDVQLEVLGHLVVVGGVAGAHADLAGVCEPAGGDLAGDLVQLGLGGGQQRSALAGALVGHEGVAAGDEPLAGIVGIADLGEVGLVEQRQLATSRPWRAF